ncbi:MAG: BON domain-containing protein [Candidatus Promineifilaceae bacterium]|nr:BON domain-containing protein [Candidatus Promineifilaceae bacterium]
MRTDEAIKKDLIDQLYWDNRIDASDITVTVDDGNVTLTGEVQTHRAREAAARNAWLVEGVVFVDNQLKLAYAEPETLPTDAEVQEEILDSFRWNPDLRSYKIDVDVENGWVTLEGTLDAFWKKVDAESEAFATRGVVGVTNKLAIVPTESISDEMIAEDVVDAIERNLRVSADDVDVTVMNGRVTLEGTVPTAAAKVAAYNSALYTAGVKDVQDNIIVREPVMSPA